MLLVSFSSVPQNVALNMTSTFRMMISLHSPAQGESRQWPRKTLRNVL